MTEKGSDDNKNVSPTDSDLEGKAFKEDVEAGGDVLWKARNSSIEGDVEAGEDVLRKARDSSIEGDVKAEVDVLWKARDSSIEGDVKAEVDVLPLARDSSIEGDVEAGRDVLRNARDSSIEGNVEAGGDVLPFARDSSIEGDVKAEVDVLWKARDSSIEGDVEAGESVLSFARNSYILSDKLDAGSLGVDARGGLVASREVDAGKIGENITVITPEDVQRTVKYNGDWEELSGFLSKEFKKDDFGELKPLELFTIEEDEIGFDGFKNGLEELNSVYEEVKEEYSKYKRFVSEEIFVLEDIGSKSNKDKVDYLEELDDELEGKVTKKLGVEKETSKKVLDSKKPADLTKELDNWQNGEVDPEEFIERYYGGVGKSYERKYILETGEVATEKNVGKMNDKLYREGLEVLEAVRRGNARYDIDEDLNSYEEIEKLVEERAGLGPEIGELKKNDEEGEADEKIEGKRKLDEKIAEKKEEIVSEAIENLLDNPENPSIGSVKECLNQLSQHYLGGRTRKNARRISESLTVQEEDLETGSALKFNRWRKDLSDVPTYDETRCCAMLGFGGGNVFDYMASESVDILEFKAGDKYGIGITVYGRNEAGEKVMLVDSVESGSHIFDRKDVSKAVSEAVEDFARKRGCSEVVYSGTPGNNAPKEFYNNLEGYEQVDGESVHVKGADELYLEADLESVESKKVKL